ncbi:MAG: DivIVA domain-containing protein [Actinobacteria bacterium]|jgi:DivIVA domain-containing protein|nr:DivIVA domain-containing protein [Actinomycetota bacterium]
MALTPEDVLNQKFTITKFRDGYDLDQVDEFLDTIVEELKEREQNEAALREQIEAANAEIESLKAQLADGDVTPASERTIVVNAPAPQPVAVAEAPRSHDADAVKSSAMLQLALELHDKHVHEGETTRDQLIAAAETKADELVSEAEDKRADVLRKLEGESNDLRDVIKELRDFEGEYRSTLRSYIQSQLRNLDGSPEPDGAPSGLN